MKTAFREQGLFGLHFLAVTLLVRHRGFDNCIIINLFWKFLYLNPERVIFALFLFFTKP